MQIDLTGISHQVELFRISSPTAISGWEEFKYGLAATAGCFAMNMKTVHLPEPSIDSEFPCLSSHRNRVGRGVQRTLEEGTGLSVVEICVAAVYSKRD